jgi:hypothetical protein
MYGKETSNNLGLGHGKRKAFLQQAAHILTVLTKLLPQTANISLKWEKKCKRETFFVCRYYVGETMTTAPHASLECANTLGKICPRESVKIQCKD